MDSKELKRLASDTDGFDRAINQVTAFANNLKNILIMNKMEEGLNEFKKDKEKLLSELIAKAQAFSDEYPSFRISIVLAHPKTGNVEKGKIFGSTSYELS